MKTAADADDISPISPNNVVPLRTVLQNFLNLVESYESKRNCGIDAYEKEFQELKIFSENLKSDPDYQCKEGEKSVSRKKNRYKDILPFDYTRVTLTPEDDVQGSDYINANFIKGASGSSAYIACQGPLSHTVNDFWKMVVECEVQVIVMACMEQESGKHKCEKYWVDEDGVEKEFGQVTVWLKKCRNVCADFLVRTMRIRFTNLRGVTEERNVCQFHYSAWPDHGIPNKVSPLLDMVRLIRDCQTSETLPVLVHCSAGCGRTGTICAIDYVWGLLRLGKLTADFSLFQLVKDMRRQRIAMVQTKDQYILVHRAVKELFQEQLKIIDAHIYANLDQHGFPFTLKLDLQEEEPTYETIEFADNCRVKHVSPAELTYQDGSSKSNKSELTEILPKAHGFKLKRDLGNHVAQPDHNKQSVGSVQLKSQDSRINSLSSSDELSESEKSEVLTNDNAVYENCVTKYEAPASISLKPGLLRKPSIIKLKSFFERSPKELKEKKASTQLNRAKSDVSSSRFYSFTSSFGSSKRSNSPSSSASAISKPKLNVSPLQSAQVQPNEPVKEKTNKTSSNKPPILAKPALPIKRSKSLKISHDPSNSFVNPVTSSIGEVGRTRAAENVDSSLAKSVSSSSSSFTHHSAENPIKVCVRQLETPKIQSIVASERPEVFTASTFNTEEKNSIERDYKSFNHSDSAPRKPPLPTVIGASKACPNYVNIGYGGNRSKVGVAKEMEDISNYSRSSGNKGNKGVRKKYDTVNARSLGQLSGGESVGSALTRSQSHVWQHEKLQLANRIFSDDNLCNSKTDQADAVSSDSPERFSIRDPNSWESNPRILKVNPLPLTTNCSIDSSYTNETTKFAQSEPPTKTETPIIRQRILKTNPYTNIPLTGADVRSPVLKKAEETPKIAGNIFGPQRFRDYNSQSKTTNNSSIGNSSESSNSNTGTPRNSLPGTPTQSIDGLYPHQIKSSSGLKNSSNLSKIHNTITFVRDSDSGSGLGFAPKSILKGSLSSSSESDDRMENTKLISSKSRTSPLFTTTTSVLGSSNGGSSLGTPIMNSGRTPLGVRERRNSFRQAVWKEAQNDGQQYHSNSNQTSLQPLTQSFTFPPVYATSSSSTQPTIGSSLERTSARNRKDYEPIWPQSKAVPIHVSSTYVSKNSFEPSSSQPSNSGMSSQIYHHNNIDSQRYGMSNPQPTSTDKIPNSQCTDSLFQSKLQEIKVLLEGLSTPQPMAASSSNVEAAKTNILTHQRSLKSPSRSQYQQQQTPEAGLSCFNFRKTNSFESISDQFELGAEENQPLVSTKSPFTFFSDSHQRNTTANTQSNSASSRIRTDMGGFESSGHLSEAGVIEATPVPPPRTKAKKNMVHDSKDSIDGFSAARMESRRPSLSVWNNSERDIYSSRAPRTPAFTHSDDRQEVEHQRSMTNGNLGGSSPKSLSRAFGAFQAKAASVRSKFANWTEPKEKGHNYKSQSNGNSTQIDADESGFMVPVHLSKSPVSLTSTSGQTRTTRHQYL